jgi:WD40 repeat protein
VTTRQVQDVMFTDHKVPTSLDSSRDLIISGHEDSLIRLWDLRSGQQERKIRSQFEGHSNWVS